MTAKKAEPTLKEMAISFSSDGNVAIVKYDEKSGWFVSHSETWTIPPDMSVEAAEEFRSERYAEMRELVDGLGQVERDERFSQSYMSD